MGNGICTLSKICVFFGIVGNGLCVRSGFLEVANVWSGNNVKTVPATVLRETNYDIVGSISNCVPVYACSRLLHKYDDGLFVLVEIGGCSLESKLYRVSKAGYKAVVFYNGENEAKFEQSQYEEMSQSWIHREQFPSIKYIAFVTNKDAKVLKSSYLFPWYGRYLIRAASGPSSVSAHYDLLLPIVALAIFACSPVLICWGFSVVLPALFSLCDSPHRFNLQYQYVPLVQDIRRFQAVLQQRIQDVITTTGEVCSICLDPFEMDTNGKIHRLVCRHDFHSLCIQDWFLQSGKLSCPYCRCVDVGYMDRYSEV